MPLINPFDNDDRGIDGNGIFGGRGLGGDGELDGGLFGGARNQTRYNREAAQTTNREIEIILARQERRCRHCSKRLGDNFQIDHIRPISQGGSNDISNKQALCPNCHAKKSKIDTKNAASLKRNNNRPPRKDPFSYDKGL